ncbi:MAG: hypothetical protein DME51_04020 [Verrucomicrobia bacterium]|nr:MAG: hypothetical protein DME51_04020 [Verrucomicrobiota bacterium]
MLRSIELVSGEYFCCAFETVLLAPRPNGLAANSARERPVVMINRPIKTRRLKKADREEDFFFIGCSLS